MTTSTVTQEKKSNRIQINQEWIRDAREITAIVQNYQSLSKSDTGGFEISIYAAQALNSIRELFSDEMLREVRKLENTRMGYLTDRNPFRAKQGEKVTPYPDQIVKDCLMEGALRGYRWMGNEINILAGSFYATKEGLLRKIREQVQGYRETVEPPTNFAGGNCQLKVSATWFRDGKKESTNGIASVRVNNGMGVDAILGKAEAKLRRMVLFVLGDTEEAMKDPDTDAMDIESTEEEVDIDTHSQMIQEFTKRLNEDSISYYTVRTILKGKIKSPLPGQLADIPEDTLHWMLDKWGWIKNEAKAAKGGEA